MKQCFNYFLEIKVDVTKPNTPLIWITVSEWFVVRFISINWHQHDVCLKGIIGLRAQNMLTILGSIVNHVQRDLCDDIMSTRIFSLIMNKIFVWAPKTKEQMGTGTVWIYESSCTKGPLYTTVEKSTAHEF